MVPVDKLVGIFLRIDVEGLRSLLAVSLKKLGLLGTIKKA